MALAEMSISGTKKVYVALEALADHGHARHEALLDDGARPPRHLPGIAA